MTVTTVHRVESNHLCLPQTKQVLKCDVYVHTSFAAPYTSSTTIKPSRDWVKHFYYSLCPWGVHVVVRGQTSAHSLHCVCICVGVQYTCWFPLEHCSLKSWWQNSEQHNKMWMKRLCALRPPVPSYRWNPNSSIETALCCENPPPITVMKSKASTFTAAIKNDIIVLWGLDTISWWRTQNRSDWILDCVYS